MRATTGRLESVVWALVECCHSKVGDFDVQIFVQQNVLRLQVSMADIEGVAIANGAENLPEVLHCFLLFQPSLFRDLRKKFAIVHKLENQVSVIIRPAVNIEDIKLTYISVRFSQISYNFIIFGCCISFMMATSRSIPIGILRRPSFESDCMASALSIAAKLPA